MQYLNNTLYNSRKKKSFGNIPIKNIVCTIHNNGNFSRDSKKIKHIQLHKKSATCMIDIMQIRNYPEMDPGSLK